MDRRPFSAAVVVAMALLVFTPGEALGQSDAVEPAPDPAATESSTAVPAPAPSDSSPPSDTTSTPATSEPAATDSAAPAPASEAAPTVPSDPAPTTTPTPPADTGSTGSPSGGSAAGVSTDVAAVVEEEDAYLLAQPVSQTSSTAADSRPAAPVSAPPVLDRGGPGVLPATPGAAPARGSGGGRAGTGLKRALPEMERDLREVQAQINDLRRRLDQGTPAPAVSIINLRLTLESLRPALVALDGRLDARELTPAMERQVRSLRARLEGTQASAAGLLGDLKRSGAYGLELGLLVRQLEGFTALDLGPIAAPAGAGSRPEQPAAQPSHAGVQPAPSVSRALPPAPAADLAGSQSRPPATPGAVSPDDDPAPLSLPAGSASPGSALSAAGVAALAALLIGLSLSRLRVALAVAPSRRYAVMFLSPLERPG